MKELSQIRMAVLDALRGAGIQAMEVFPEKQAMAYSGVVAAVGVGAASGKTAGFCHYLGEMKDPETQAVRERYGKELFGQITVELRANQAAFAALANCDVQVVVCDSSELTIQKALKTAVETASAARGERIGVIGGSGDTAAQLVTRAEAINSERMVLVGPDMKDESGKALSGVFAAAAVAGAIACGADPAVPLNGAELYGIGGLQSVYSDNDIDLLVQGGVTPLEDVGGVVSPVRGITTRTKTGSAADSTWRELTTVLIADDVIPAVRSALRSKFARAKNTAQGRGAIRAQTIVELEKKKDAQIIESYGEVAVTAAADDPTVCLVEFSFAVAHGLNQIRLTVHLTV